MDLNVFAPKAAQTATKADFADASKPSAEAQGSGASFGQVVAQQEAADAGRSDGVVMTPYSRGGDRPDRTDDASATPTRVADHANAGENEKAAANTVAALAGGLQAAAAEARPERGPFGIAPDAAKGVENKGVEGKGAGQDHEAVGDSDLGERTTDGATAQSDDHIAADNFVALDEDTTPVLTDFEAAFEERPSDAEPKVVAREATAASLAAAPVAGAEALERSAQIVAAMVETPSALRKNAAAETAGNEIEVSGDEVSGDSAERSGTPKIDVGSGKPAEANPITPAAAFKEGVDGAGAATPESAQEPQRDLATDAAAPREPRQGVESPTTDRSTGTATVATAAATASAAPTGAAATPSGIEMTQLQAAAPSGASASGAPLEAPAGSSMQQPVPTPESQRAAQPVIAALRGREGSQTIEIRLDPAELGRVEIDIKYEGDKVTVALRADRDDALDLMRRHGSDFLKELKESGIDVSNMSFERRENGQNAFGGDSQSEAGERWSAARAIQTDDAALAETAQSMAAESSLRTGGQLGLDLRV